MEAELSTPSSGATGIPANLIQVFAQGETSEFGAALDQNRRATIAADVAPPAPCANPGVQRSIDLQPVFLRTGPADAAPTGTSWRRRFDEANRIWGKLAVTFNELTPVTIDTPLKTTGNDLVERDAIAALRTGTAVQVFIVDNDMAFAGGAWDPAARGSSTV